MSSPRARILARRAAFVAAALRSVAGPTQARADEAPPPPPDGPTPPEAPPVICLSPPDVPPPEPPPHVCLSAREPPPANEDAWDLGFGATTPRLLVPLARASEPWAVGEPRLGALWTVFLQRQLSVGSLRLSVQSGFLRATVDARVPIGGTLGFFGDLRPRSWHFEHRFVYGIELGGGAFLGDATRPYVEVAATPLGFTFHAQRGRDERPSRFVSVGLRGSMLMVDTGPTGDRAFGVRAFTLGIDVTFGVQIVKPSERHESGS